MSKPRGPLNSVEELVTLIGDLASRLQAVELVAHRHDQPASALVPAGAIIETLWLTDPLGFLLLDGRTIVNGQTLYPSLWAVAPAGWKSGSSLVLPTRANMMVRAF